MPDPILRDLDTHPRYSYPFLWADYVELLTLCGQDGQFSRGNLEEGQQEGGDLQGDESDGETTPSSTAEQDDAIARRWDDIKGRLRQRQAAYSVWPFKLEGDVLRRDFDQNRPEHRLYAALLIASSLRLCHKTREGEVAAALEEIGYLLLIGMLPVGWKVKPFGAHQSIEQAYTGTLRSKLEQLAQDVHGILQKPADDYDPADTGDGGIDVVAWDDLGDSRGHIPVIFAQCGCSPTDWEHKQLSVTCAAIESHIKPQHPGAAYYITPHDLSSSDNKWDRASHVANVVLLDRRRLLYLAQQYAIFPHIPMWSFVAEAASLSYSLTA